MLNVFQNSLERLISECLLKGYVMLLEADVYGWLFHILITDDRIKPDQIHLVTRICCADESKKFDIVFGDIQNNAWDGKGKRPCVDPKLVIEVKLFPSIGFITADHRENYVNLIKGDLPKLNELNEKLCAVLVVDSYGYLQGNSHGSKTNRLDELISTRNSLAPKVHIFIVRLINNDWKIEYKEPVNQINNEK
jgi:hypothetical protein